MARHCSCERSLLCCMGAQQRQRQQLYISRDTLMLTSARYFQLPSRILHASTLSIVGGYIYIHVHIRMCISFLFSPFLKFSVPSIFSRIGWAMSTSLLHCCILSLGYAALAAFIRFSANVNSSKAPPLFLSTAQIVQWAHTAHCQLCGCPHTLRRFNLVLFFFFL